MKSETDAYYWIDKHDLFNLVALIPLNGINMMHIKMCWFSEARAMDLFWVFYSVTVLYFVVDLAWIYIKPQSVKSPKFIMGHHVVTMSYLLIPYNYPHLAWCMSLCMSVEINTWFIIARRRWNHPLACSFFFYLTWFGIRLILYPILVIQIYKEWKDYSAETGTHLNIIAIAPIFQVLLVCLNVKWTIDLFKSKMKGTTQKGL